MKLERQVPLRHASDVDAVDVIAAWIAVASVIGLLVVLAFAWRWS